ncbi:uncharacterized protein LOC121784868 [Salvia splendens]|uniref:uncharacterized protein LOC121784868 n=1 Tax=Salvia splendens TaxID=180675 RepID=UPI001C258B2D|nr:uncharacterized protein LOC121784868 [Salvia splendens]
MESAASHSHPLLLTSEPSKQQSASTNDEGTSRKRSAAEDSSEKPPLAPTKRGRSQYWKHFEKTMKKTSQGERKIGICNYCKSEVPTLTGSTTGLKYHLEKKCELSPFYAASGNNKGQTVLTKETMGKGSQIVPHSFNQKRCELKVTEYVITDEVSFRAVEGKGFVALVHELEPRFRIPDRKKVADPIMSEVAKAMKVKFDKYWGDWNKMNPVIFIANVLDPRNKLKMLQVSVKKLKRFGDSNQEVRELCDRFKNDLVTLWAEYKGVSDTLVTQKPLLENSGDRDDTGLGGSGLFDELYNGVQEEVSQDQLNQISNEVDKYLADEMEKRSNPCFDLLEWWKGSGTRYPILSLIAKDIFAIPSSTVASESAFSLGKRVVDHFRTSLSPKMVEALVCTNDWLKADDFSLYKDPTDDDLAFYQEIEEIEKSSSHSTITQETRDGSPNVSSTS